jgi:hypothetical protein
MRHKSVRATENPLRDSLVNGREKAKTIVIVEASAKNLERQQLSLRRRVVFRKGGLRKRQDAIKRKRVCIPSCMIRHSPEETQQVRSTHTPGIGHEGSKSETNRAIRISVLSPLTCFHFPNRGRLEHMIFSPENMSKLNIHNETSESIKVRRNLKGDSSTASGHHVSTPTRRRAYAGDLSLCSSCRNAAACCNLSQLLSDAIMRRMPGACSMPGPIEEAVTPPINLTILGLLFHQKTGVRNGISKKEGRGSEDCRIRQLVRTSQRKKAHGALFESVGSAERGRADCRIRRVCGGKLKGD